MGNLSGLPLSGQPTPLAPARENRLTFDRREMFGPLFYFWSYFGSGGGREGANARAGILFHAGRGRKSWSSSFSWVSAYCTLCPQGRAHQSPVTAGERRESTTHFGETGDGSGRVGGRREIGSWARRLALERRDEYNQLPPSLSGRGGSFSWGGGSVSGEHQAPLGRDMLIDCGALPAYRGYYSALEEILAVCSPQGQDPWGPSLVEGAGPVAGPGGAGPDPGPDPTLTRLLSVCQLASFPFPFPFFPSFSSRGALVGD